MLIQQSARFYGQHENLGLPPTHINPLYFSGQVVLPSVSPAAELLWRTLVLDLPFLSIVTPSFNQAPFLEETITSVLSQNYPRREYIVIDGGSTDGSVDIVRNCADRLTYWISEEYHGQYDAINKGFEH